MTDTLYYTTHQSSIGNLLLVASNRGLQYLRLLEATTRTEEKLAEKYPQLNVTRLDDFFTSTLGAIDRYLAGEEELKLPVDLAGGTPLQRTVWLEIARIPYGETISYTTLANRVGFPRAVRAVASACGANPVPLAIACHRIVAKDGTLGGFSLGGADVKETLLKTEAAKSQLAA